MIKLIIADDEAFTLRSLKELIDWEGYGYHIVGLCKNGTEVLELMSKDPADIILTDIKMPEMDGIELSKQCYELYPQTHIVLLSAHRDFELARKALKYNVKNYILKPVSYTGLCETMKEIAQDFESERIMDVCIDKTVFARQQILTEMAEGLFNIKEIEARLFSVGWDIKLFEVPCASFKIYIENFSEYMSEMWHHKAERIYAAISSLIYLSNHDFEPIVTKYYLNVIEVLIINKNGCCDFNEAVNGYIGQLPKIFLENLHLKTKIAKLIFSSSAFELMQINKDAYSLDSLNDDGIIRQAIEYIQENYQTATLTNTAEHVCLSPAYFSVYFKKSTGKSFVSTVNEIRIQKAKELLEKPETKPSIVYHLVGYASQSYFNKLFSSMENTTPAQYQKRQLIKQ